MCCNISFRFLRVPYAGTCSLYFFLYQKSSLYLVETHLETQAHWRKSCRRLLAARQGVRPPTREAGWRPEAGRPQVQARPGGKLWARGSGAAGQLTGRANPIFTCQGEGEAVLGVLSTRPAPPLSPGCARPHCGPDPVGSLTLCSYLLCAFDPFVSLPECPLFSAWLTPG